MTNSKKLIILFLPYCHPKTFVYQKIIESMSTKVKWGHLRENKSN